MLLLPQRCLMFLDHGSLIPNFLSTTQAGNIISHSLVTTSHRLIMSDMNIYDISVGVYINAVTTLIHILKKAALQPDATDLPSARLISDMQPLSFQVQSVSNNAVKSLKRLGLDVSMFEDNETTMKQLISRSEKTLSLLESIDPATLEGKETATVSLPGGSLTGKQIILGWPMPNIFFHLQAAYCILRMKGVPLGKQDYLDPWHDGDWDRAWTAK